MLCDKIKYCLLISALCTSVRLLHYTKSNHRILHDEVKEHKRKQRFDDEGEEIGTRFRSYRRDERSSYGNNTLTNSSSDANNFTQTEKKGFYDAATNFCELCQETLEASYRGHSECNEHTARTGIYERAIRLIDKYIEHLMQVRVRRDNVSFKRSKSTNNNNNNNYGNKNSSYNHYINAQNDLTRLFAFFDQALPYDKEVIRAEPSLLEKVDLLSILIDYWWQSINCTSAVQDLNGAMRFEVGSCASYLKRIQEADEKYNFRERSFVETQADEHIKNVDFDRIPSLSSSNMMERKWRICFLLIFLRERGVLRNSLQISSVNEETISRQQSLQEHYNAFKLSERFERAELVGDEIMKAMTFDRLARMFPLHECGGIDEELYVVLRLIDCNHGLLTIYDYLDLDRLLQMRLPNSKSKSDVVEAIFGELECWLSSSEVACGVERFSIDPSPEFKYVNAIVKHTLSELSHVILMWEVEQTLRNVSEFVKSHIAHSPILRMTKRAANNQLWDEERDRAPHDLLPLLIKVKRGQPLTKNTGKSAWVCAQELSETYQSKVTPFEQTLSESPTLNNNNNLDASTEYTATKSSSATAKNTQEKWPLLTPYLLPMVLNKKNFSRNACKLLKETDLTWCPEVDKGIDEQQQQHANFAKVTIPSRIHKSINEDTNNLAKNTIDCAKLSTGAQRYRAWRQHEIDFSRREMANNTLRNLQLPQVEVSKLLNNRMIALSSSMQSNRASTLPDFSLAQKQM